MFPSFIICLPTACPGDPQLCDKFRCPSRDQDGLPQRVLTGLCLGLLEKLFKEDSSGSLGTMCLAFPGLEVTGGDSLAK